jgi:hypothetical protein
VQKSALEWGLLLVEVMDCTLDSVSAQQSAAASAHTSAKALDFLLGWKSEH